MVMGILLKSRAMAFGLATKKVMLLQSDNATSVTGPRKSMGINLKDMV